MWQLRLYDKTFKFQGAVGAWTSMDVTLIRNRVSELRVVVPAGHPQAAKMRANGARVVLLDDDTGYQLFTGQIRGLKGSGPGDERVEFRAESDMRMLTRITGWPSPTKPLTEQTGDNNSGYRKFQALPLETVLKQVAFENAQRLGVPISMAPTQGRGGNVNADFRFNPVLDQLQGMLDASNLTIRIFQVTGTGLRLDVRESKEIRKELSIRAGTLVDYEWSTESADATRAVVGGQGEAAARVFRTSTYSTWEGWLGYPEEIFVDARDAEDAAELSGRGTEKLNEGRSTAGLSLTLSETPSFKYGVHYELGDTVTISTAAGPITDKVRQINMSFTRENGLQITPLVGERTDDPDIKLAKYAKNLAVRTAHLERK